MRHIVAPLGRLSFTVALVVILAGCKAYSFRGEVVFSAERGGEIFREAAGLELLVKEDAITELRLKWRNNNLDATAIHNAFCYESAENGYTCEAQITLNASPVFEVLNPGGVDPSLSNMTGLVVFSTPPNSASGGELQLQSGTSEEDVFHLAMEFTN